MKKVLLMICVLFATATLSIQAQNNTNSPYTRFGYGQLHDGAFGRSQAMGGVSIGMRSKGNVNPVNPAAYSCIDSTSFLFDMGVSGLLANFSSGDSHRNTFTGNLEYVALQFPIGKWMGMSIGMLPYSFVGYSYGFKDSVQIQNPINDSVFLRNERSFAGNGGISQAYLGLSFNLWKRVSLGANFYYLFGNIDHLRYENKTSTEGTVLYSTTSKSNMHVRSFNTRFGIQYHQPIGKTDELIFGAIYEYKSKLHNTLDITSIAADTVTTSNAYDFQLPSVYGGGVSYMHDGRLTVGVDFLWQDFAKAKYYGAVDSLHNRMKVSVGAEYIHDPMGQKYIDHMMWRLGANYTSSYINVNGVNTNDISITCGVGFPLRTIKSIVNFNFEYGHIGSQASNMLREQYFKFGLNISINENWFFKQTIK